MKLATAPVNWNNDDAPDYRDWTPYPQLIKEMVAAGYSATEWGMNMPKDPRIMNADLRSHGLQMLGGFVGFGIAERGEGGRGNRTRFGDWAVFQNLLEVVT